MFYFIFCRLCSFSVYLHCRRRWKVTMIICLFYPKSMKTTMNKSRNKPICKENPRSSSNFRSRTIFCCVESFLLKLSPDILAPCISKLNSLNYNCEFSVSCCLPSCQKYSIVQLHGLRIYVRKNLLMARL